MKKSHNSQTVPMKSGGGRVPQYKHPDNSMAPHHRTANNTDAVKTRGSATTKVPFRQVSK